jgi:hypothetical protein
MANPFGVDDWLLPVSELTLLYKFDVASLFIPPRIASIHVFPSLAIALFMTSSHSSFREMIAA